MQDDVHLETINAEIEHPVAPSDDKGANERELRLQAAELARSRSPAPCHKVALIVRI